MVTSVAGEAWLGMTETKKVCGKPRQRYKNFEDMSLQMDSSNKKIMKLENIQNTITKYEGKIKTTAEPSFNLPK